MTGNRDWVEDCEYIRNSLYLLKARGKIAAVVMELVITKGLPNHPDGSWDDSELTLLSELTRVVNYLKNIKNICMLVKITAAERRVGPPFQRQNKWSNFSIR